MPNLHGDFYKVETGNSGSSSTLCFYTKYFSPSFASITTRFYVTSIMSKNVYPSFASITTRFYVTSIMSKNVIAG